MNAKWTATLFASLFSGAALAAGGAADFHTLDNDNDGYVTKDDISSNSAITDEWDTLDVNDDDRLDQAEFARFETMTGTESSDGVPKNPPGTEGYDSYGGASGTDAPSGQLGAEPGDRAR